MPQKPYSFVSLPKDFHTQSPVWHDGSCSQTRLSGEVRFELQNLTPLLVGWERQQAGIPKPSDPWPLPVSKERTEQGTKVVDIQLDKSYTVKVGKSVLCPLRAPWEHCPVLIPGDSIKGLLRHELGALLGAPMERVAERSYSYRPNLKFPVAQAGRRLEPRLARVLTTKTIQVEDNGYPIPDSLDILCMATRDDQTYYPRWGHHHAPPTAMPYRGGMGAGIQLPPKCLSPDAAERIVHTSVTLAAGIHVESSNVTVSARTAEQYKRTLGHYFSDESGHFSSRHPAIGNDASSRDQGIDALKAGARRAFQPGDLIWVEWDTSKKQIVSFGWHYYYRWAYQDTVRTVGMGKDRPGLVPLDKEKGDKPAELSLVRRLFGYAADDNNGGVKGIGNGNGNGNHSQLMGRISVNAAIEVIEPGKEDEKARFEEPIFLKELGQPKPSAVENYLKQPTNETERRTLRSNDKATLVTYGDAVGYDTPGQLAGRKFYLDRADAYNPYSTPNKIAPWKDAKESNRLNDRSTLAIDVSKPEHRFRFTLRFRDLDMDELAAVLLALCPDQFAKTVGGTHKDGYCSKLGYGRPLGLGTVRIEAKELHFLEHDANGNPTLKPESVSAWFGNHVKLQSFPVLTEWLNVHQHKHPQGQDYERDPDDKEIFTVHTKLRAKHSKQRRYK